MEYQQKKAKGKLPPLKPIRRIPLGWQQKIEIPVGYQIKRTDHVLMLSYCQYDLQFYKT